MTTPAPLLSAPASHARWPESARACVHGATRNMYLDESGACKHYCSGCASFLAPEHFRPSTLRREERVCRTHEYARQKRRLHERARAPDIRLLLRRVVRTLQQRERARGGPAVHIAIDEARRLLCRHGFTSALSGCRVTEATAALVRRDESRPFDERTNCMLITKHECHAQAVKRVLASKKKT